jgi:hypothetical protein
MRKVEGGSSGVDPCAGEYSNETASNRAGLARGRNASMLTPARTRQNGGELIILRPTSHVQIPIPDRDGVHVSGWLEW